MKDGVLKEAMKLTAGTRLGRYEIRSRAHHANGVT